ncbi:MAG TPA: 2-oxo acid dehydrogenase subunit E2 [Thermoanaerobacterales bacterium]|nr:2-oxo acid dehydrogenase subunit E2 [Thermoanaerobacterales bacterium]
MAIEIVMPKLGLTMTKGTVEKWLKKEGDLVQKGDSLLEISTEKLTNTVESPGDGILLKIVAEEGAELPIGTVLGFIGEAGEHIDVAGKVNMPKMNNSLEASSGPEKQEGNEENNDSGFGKKVKISPAALNLARDLNIDYTLVVGTGPGGRITREDVKRYVEQMQTGKVEKQDNATVSDIKAPVSFEEIPYAGLRKVIGEKMSRSWTLAAKVTAHVSADVSKLLQLRTMINEDLENEEDRISITEMLVKLVAKALEIKPMINVSLEGDSIKVMKDINIGVAVALENGLVVPVVRNADKKGLYQLSKEVKELVRKAREGRLSLDEMSGGTFTITNLGTYGSVDYFTPIINQPESAILGIGRIAEAPMVINGQIVARPMMGLSLSFDHRLIDGAPAAEFMAVLLRIIANPFRAILR